MVLVEQLARIVAIYIITVAMLRLAGKRRIASLSSFDILIIIALGSAVGDVMLYPESTASLQNGAVVVVAVIVLQVIMSKLTEHSSAARYLIEGTSTVLIKDGKIDYKQLDNEDIAEDELYELLREKGVAKPSEVKLGMLERSGELGLILYDSGRKKSQNKSRARLLKLRHA